MSKLYKLKCELEERIETYKTPQEKPMTKEVKGILVGLNMAMVIVEDMMSQDTTVRCDNCKCTDITPLVVDVDNDWECACCGTRFN